MSIHDIQSNSESGSCRRHLVIGLTGPIASGKSTVANHLRNRGAEIIDADQVYRSLLVPGSDLSRQIENRFGSRVVRDNGTIDRAALGDLVFRDATALAHLDAITHPAVVAEIRRLISLSDAPVIVIEAVKLVQSGLASDVDSLWFVNADEETRLRRLMTRRGMDEAKARARIAAAPKTIPEGTRVDFFIDNSGDLATLLRDVDGALEELVSNTIETPHDLIVSAPEESS